MRSHGDVGVKTRMYVSPHDIEVWVKDIVDHLILSDTQPIHILAVGRGGLIPAAKIAYLYGCKTDTYPTIEAINVSSYHNENRGELKFHNALDQHSKGKKTLIVDDITDSGSTLFALLQLLPHAQTAVMVYKETSSVKPDFCGHVDKKGNQWWFVMPWELER